MSEHIAAPHHRECPRHATDIRCAHANGSYVVLRRTEWPHIFEVTTGFDDRPGSLTAPIDDARKHWAFEDFEQRYLRAAHLAAQGDGPENTR